MNESPEPNAGAAQLEMLTVCSEFTLKGLDECHPNGL